MSTALEKKYIEIIEIILESLLLQDQDELESLLQPLRIFIHDVPRFSSNRIFVSKFRAFLETRDEVLAEQAEVPEVVPGKDQQTKKTVNHLLDQALALLEDALRSSSKVDDSLKGIVDKIQEAKTVNNLRALSAIFLDAGSRMRAVGQDFQNDVGRIAVELSFYQKQIEILENALQQSKLEAERDHLTRLWNRRIFDRNLEEAVQRANRFHGPLSLLLVDIDHFKEINDEWGHQVGDDVLVNFAGLLNTSLRELDLTYRLGGDEFAVIFSGSNGEQSLMVAHRLHQFVGRNPYHIEKVRFQTTISGGLTQYRDGETPAAFFKRADDQLYRAKRSGRNKICSDVHDPPDTFPPI
ncbi:GGDEF domain-containing protein [Acanthopleuribacter pedis]|uniref:diguanylate cyclase n=1 Tax=Acanthopleuribacter pedis TaxID=442870 RepID=A0A8J7Q9M0_9BACT|nr:GGDEF domain-containing protein [Acanthopleuribacter pedis]MBO1316931.1 GGDEF domain-containing protein [Acanthopleuribacter pedis]